MIIAIIILIMAVVALALIIFKVPVSQGVINILLLLSLILLAVERTGWIKG